MSIEMEACVDISVDGSDLLVCIERMESSIRGGETNLF
jgi:hypothetical protein